MPENDDEAHRSDSDSDDHHHRHKKKHKKKKSKSHGTVEDALEKKLREKKKKEKAMAEAEAAIEAKIRKKKLEMEAKMKSEDETGDEEKVEEGLSVSSRDEYDKSFVSKGADTAIPLTFAAGAAGGGDVRNRPPPTDGLQQVDPLRAAQLAEEERQKNAKQVNKRFMDLHETGQWGGLSKWEKYGLCFFALAAVIAAIVLGVNFAKGPATDAPTAQPTPPPTTAPSLSPTPGPTGADYREILGLQLMKAASPTLALRVENPEELIGASIDPNSTPQEIAAEYLLYDDTMEIPAEDPRFLERYALAVFYYSNGGCGGDWIDTSKWMSGEDHCEWFGVVCDLTGQVTEFDMGGNYATGEIPVELGQILELSTLDLSNNRMGGTVPFRALNISSLFTLRLENNDLSGIFPFDDLIAGSPLLNNLWIQENSKLSGNIPESFCGLFTITLDCDNFSPQPTYTSDGTTTTFESRCIEGTGTSPTEFTCNAEAGVPVTKPPSPTPSGENICGTPVGG